MLADPLRIKRHADRINESAVNSRRPPEDAFAHEAHLFIESNGTAVVFVDIELDPQETGFLRRLQRGVDELSPQPLPR